MKNNDNDTVGGPTVDVAGEKMQEAYQVIQLGDTVDR